MPMGLVYGLALIAAVILFGLLGYVFDVARASVDDARAYGGPVPDGRNAHVPAQRDSVTERIEIGATAAGETGPAVVSIVLRPAAAQAGASDLPRIDVLADGKTLIITYDPAAADVEIAH